MAGYLEKRDFHRMKVETAVDYQANGDGQAARGKMMNLSAVGVQFAANDAFEIGARLSLEIHGGHQGQPLCGEATVLRCEQRDEGYQVACSFTVTE